MRKEKVSPGVWRHVPETPEEVLAAENARLRREADLMQRRHEGEISSLEDGWRRYAEGLSYLIQRGATPEAMRQFEPIRRVYHPVPSGGLGDHALYGSRPTGCLCPPPTGLSADDQAPYRARCGHRG